MRIQRDQRGFCAAPWTEGVMRRSGVLQVCCRNETPLGDWVRDGLDVAWRTPAFARFRGEVAAGRIPDEACRGCIARGGARSLAADLGGPYQRHLGTVAEALGGLPPELARLGEVLQARTWSSACEGVFPRYEAALEAVAPRLAGSPAEPAVSALRVVGRVARAYLLGEAAPPQVAPFRQVELSDRCNARCVHCVFLHSGELEEGATLEPAQVARAFSQPGSILDFFMYGAEFLFYPGWREVAALLARAGVKLSLSSNGMLLTPANVRHLVDGRLAARLNVSLDGSCRETVEAIRVNVSYERVLAQLEDLIAYADLHQPDLELTLSFVLMMRNYRELPAFIDLAARLRGARRVVVNVAFSGLEAYQPASYQAFLAREHHALIPRATLLAVVEETAARARAHGVAVSAFHAWRLEEFLAAGAPFPPPPPAP